MPEDTERNERGERSEADLLHQDLRRLFMDNEAVVGTGKNMLALISGTTSPGEDSDFIENVLVMNSIDDSEVAYNIMLNDSEHPDEGAFFVSYPTRVVYLMPGMPEASSEDIETLRIMVSHMMVDNIAAQAIISDITDRP